jgi:hypothetical protein
MMATTLRVLGSKMKSWEFKMKKSWDMVLGASGADATADITVEWDFLAGG